MKRVTLFGGSFNPIHCGHIKLAEFVIAQGLTDELWLMVSPQNPLKSSPDLIDEHLRLKWAKIATQGKEKILVSDFEFHLPRPSYSYDTLQALKREFPDCTFQLLIGADNWANFHKWYRNEDIISSHHILVYPREGFPIEPTTLPENVHFIEAPLFPWSSTEIREKLRNDGDTNQMLPAELNKKEIISVLLEQNQI